MNLDAMYDDVLEHHPPPVTLEGVMTAWIDHVGGTLSPLQRAVCRIAEGVPLAELADNPHVMLALNGAVPPAVRPLRLQVLAGIRTGKSLLAAALAYVASQRVDVSRLGPGEVPRISVVSLKMDLAKVIYDHLVGNVRATPWQAGNLIGEPTASTVLLMHPTGRPIEVMVVAGSRAGSSLVSRWSAGCIFDESPRMVGADAGAVVNLDDMIDAVLGRLLPGAQIVDMGSPWAPFGPAFDFQAEFWGEPSARAVVVRARGDHLGPHYWTPAKCTEVRTNSERVYRTDVLAEFADVEAAMFMSERLDDVTRKRLVIPYEDRRHYIWVMDPATRANAWTLVGACEDEREDGTTYLRVVMAKQWQGSVDEPLDPDAVLVDIAATLKPYACASVISDQYAADALRALGRRHGLTIEEQVVTSRSKVESFSCLATLVDVGGIELPPDKLVMGDLKRVRRVVTQGGIRIELPQTSDGRHCDYAAALAMLSVQPMRHVSPEPERGPEGWSTTELAYVKRAEQRHREANGDRQRFRRRKTGRR